MTCASSDIPRSPLTLGIPLSGGRNWVAGSIYTANLARAVELAPDDVPLRAVLLERGFAPIDKALTGLGCRVVRHAGIARLPESGFRRWAKRGLSLLRSGAWRSLEQTLHHEAIDVVYPGTGFDLPVPQVNWISDLQHRRLPEMFPGDHWQQREGEVRQLLTTAPLVVVSSEAARLDCEEFYPELAAKVRSLPFVTLPADAWFATDPVNVARSVVGPVDYLVFPSQFWQHKDHATAFRAFAEFRRHQDHPVKFVCTGALHDFRHREHGDFLRKLITELGIESDVIFTGLLSRCDQIQVLRQATLILQPSRFEGWSAIIEDAQLLGKPVIASDLPVHREQNAPAVTYFASGDHQALARELRQRWPQLPTGWQPELEQAGRKRQQRRGRDFAVRIHQIMTEVRHMHSSDSPPSP